MGGRVPSRGRPRGARPPASGRDRRRLRRVARRPARPDRRDACSSRSPSAFLREAHALRVADARVLRVVDAAVARPRELGRDRRHDGAHPGRAVRRVVARVVGTGEPTDVSGAGAWLDSLEREQRRQRAARPPTRARAGRRDGARRRAAPQPRRPVARGRRRRAVGRARRRCWPGSATQAETDLLLALRRGGRAWPPLARGCSTTRARRARPRRRRDRRAARPGGGGRWRPPASRCCGRPSSPARSLELRAVARRPRRRRAWWRPVSTSTRCCEFRWQATLDGEVLTEDELDALVEAKRPLVLVRGRWVVADPSLLERLRRRSGRVRVADALAAALAGTLTIDGDETPVVVDGALVDLADRLRGLETDPRAPRTRRARRDAAPLPTAGRGLAGRDVRARPRRLPRRRHGPRQDDPAHRAPPAPARDRRRRRRRPDAGRLPDLAARQLGARAAAVRPGRSRSAATTAATGTSTTWPATRSCSRPTASCAATAAELAERGVGSRRRRRGPARQEPAGAHGPGAARDPGRGADRAHRHAGREPPHRAVGDPRLDHARPARAARDVPPHDRGARRARRATRPRPSTSRASSARSCCAGASPTRRSRPSCRRKTETDLVVLAHRRAGHALRGGRARDAGRDRATREGIARRGLVLKLLTALKQICNHPAQYLGQRGPLAGRSGKLDAFDELVDAIVDAGDSVLVFTQYVAMGRLLEQHLASRGIDVAVPARRRARAARARRWSTASRPARCRVFLLSLKAGGIGLNLTRATHVVHYDRWWNPAVEDQATDRAYRIGQDRPVQVHRLVSEGTVEDRIAALLAHEAGAGRRGRRRRRGVDQRAVRRRAGRARRPRPHARWTSPVDAARRFATTWWGQAWVDALEQRARLDPNRLPRGRTYARQERVGELTVGPGEVVRAGAGAARRAVPRARAGARVHRRRVGHRARRHRGAGRPRRRAARRRAAARGARRRRPRRGVDLLPGPGEIGPRCSCPDWADPCKHAAAVCYLVADVLDRDPFELFHLRGRDRDTVLAALRAAAGAHPTRAPAPIALLRRRGPVAARDAYARALAVGRTICGRSRRCRWSRSRAARRRCRSKRRRGSGVRIDELADLATRRGAARAWELATGAGDGGLTLDTDHDLAPARRAVARHARVRARSRGAPASHRDVWLAARSPGALEEPRASTSCRRRGLRRGLPRRR